jgi:hypothetical protein
VATAELEAPSVLGAAERERAGRYLGAHARLEFDIPGVTFGGRYDGSPVIASDSVAPPPDQPNVYVPTACPGGRPPHAWLDADRSLFDRFGDEWTLLALGSGPPCTRPFEEAAAAAGIDLRILRLPQPSLRELYEAPLALIRPDQIVAWRGAEAGVARDVLSRVLGRMPAR